MGEIEELKSLLIKVKEESGKVGLKLSIQITKIMIFSPITSWQIDGEKMETLRDFILGDSKITTDGDCSHEIKRCLLLGRNLDSILKSRDKTRVSTFTATIQHSSGSFGHSNQSRKRNKRNPNWKRRSKTLTVCR